MEVKKRLRTEFCPVEVPGNTPYKEYKVLPMEIKASEKCISCMRCVKICPFNARNADPVKVEMISEKLKKICQPNKQNEFF